MKKFYLTLFGLLLSFGVFAQKGFHFGLTTGVNNTFVLDKGLKEDPRFLSRGTYKFSPIGISTGLDFGGILGFQFEAQLGKAGQLYDVVDKNDQKIGERSMEYDYLNLPLMLRFGGSHGKVRFNAMLGPQLSLLTSGLETMQYNAGIIEIPEGAEVPSGAVDNGDGTYTVPALPETVLASTDSADPTKKMSDTDVQIVFDLGLRIMLKDNLYLNTDIRGNYGLTDMRSDEMIDALRNRDGGIDAIIGRRANLLVGLQLGLNYYLAF